MTPDQRAVRSVDRFGHGTHIAATAAGDGSASAGKWQGMAPEAELVVVNAFGSGSQSPPSSNGGLDNTEDLSRVRGATVIAGLAYVVDRATRANKPYVINLSLGFDSEDTDGSSLTELASTGAISDRGSVVAAAGNEGVSSNITTGVARAQSTIAARLPECSAPPCRATILFWHHRSDSYRVDLRYPFNNPLQINSGQIVQATIKGSTFEDVQLTVDNSHGGSTRRAPIVLTLVGDWGVSVPFDVVLTRTVQAGDAQWEGRSVTATFLGTIRRFPDGANRRLNQQPGINRRRNRRRCLRRIGSARTPRWSDSCGGTDVFRF